MTDQEILTKAITKAIAGGWEPTPRLVSFEAHHDTKYRKIKYIPYDSNVEALIFNHSFAKALWGEEFVDTGLLYQRQVGNNFIVYQTRAWQYHLQQMVIAEDPIAYLGEHM